MENEKTCTVSFLGFNSSTKLGHRTSFCFVFLKKQFEESLESDFAYLSCYIAFLEKK